MTKQEQKLWIKILFLYLGKHYSIELAADYARQAVDRLKQANQFFAKQ